MPKLLYILWRARDVQVADFHARLFGEAIPQLLQLEPEQFAVNVADIDAAFGLPVVHSEGQVAALLSLRASDEGIAGRVAEILRPLSTKAAGYVVNEVVARPYDTRTWPLGDRTPGAKLLTCFPKPARVSDEEFLQHWQETHTQLALEVHPLWCHINNIVQRALTAGAPPFRGIVEEQFRELDDVIDPDRFFGAPGNAKRVVRAARQFLDFDTIENYLMSEYLLLG